MHSILFDTSSEMKYRLKEMGNKFHVCFYTSIRCDCIIKQIAEFRKIEFPPIAMVVLFWQLIKVTSWCIVEHQRPGSYTLYVARPKPVETGFILYRCPIVSSASLVASCLLQINKKLGKADAIITLLSTWHLVLCLIFPKTSIVHYCIRIRRHRTQNFLLPKCFKFIRKNYKF